MGIKTRANRLANSTFKGVENWLEASPQPHKKPKSGNSKATTSSSTRDIKMLALNQAQQQIKCLLSLNCNFSVTLLSWQNVQMKLNKK